LFKKVLLQIAQEERFHIGVIDECAHYVRDYGQLLERVTNNLPRLARHPAYLRINGQPVWFVYQVWDDWLTAEQAGRYVEEAERTVGDVFWIFDKLKATAISEPPRVRFSVPQPWLQLKGIDCFGTYSYFGHWRDTNAANLAKLYAGFVRDTRRAGKWAQLPVLPGHDNTPVHREPLVVPRGEGAVLENFLRAVDEARPEIVVVCSFNEWLEGTQIEPSDNWSDPYLCLKLLARWRGREWKLPPLPNSAAPASK
jgi:hypothetical protein